MDVMQMILSQMMGQQQPQPQQKMASPPTEPVVIDASHPLWDEAASIFEQENGRAPATDSDMEVGIPEIIARLEDSDAGAAQGDVLKTMLGEEEEETAGKGPRTMEGRHPLEEGATDGIPPEVMEKAMAMYAKRYPETPEPETDGDYMTLDEIAAGLMSHR